MTQIVVAVDGSESAVDALGWARELAATAAEPVFHLVHSFHVPFTYPESERAVILYRQRVEQAEANGVTLLKRSAQLLAGHAVQTHLAEAVPAQAVLTVAREVDADFIAVGSRGLGRTARLFLGSVSAELVHQAQRPVLVVRQARPRPIGKVLVGVDGSDPSARGLAFAARWAPAAEISALHVLNLSPEAGVVLEGIDLPLEEAARQNAPDVVQRTVRRAGMEPGRVRALAAVGNAADEIIARAAADEYDLTVIGRRGLGPLVELLLGSVSERVMRFCPGAVVVVP